jgi:formate dehydrogenase major subunit
MNSSDSPVNRLTSSFADPATHTPAYKEVAVSLEVLPEVAESPLPRINHRFGHPTPQKGVRIEQKWNRPDYTIPGNGLVQVQIHRKQE